MDGWTLPREVRGRGFVSRFRSLALIVVLMGVGGGCGGNQGAERGHSPPPVPEVMPGEVVVIFTPEAGEALGERERSRSGVMMTGLQAVDRLNKRFQVASMRKVIRSPEDSLRARKLGLSYEYVLSFPEGRPVDQVANAYGALAAVERAYPKKLLRPLTTRPVDTESLSWALKEISAPAAWQQEQGDSSVVIAVLDTGVGGPLAGPARDGYDFVHTDTATWKREGFLLETREDYTDRDPRPIGVDEHGTVMARLAAGQGEGPPGVCPKCSILPLRVGFAVVPEAEGRRPDSSRLVRVESTDLQAALVEAADRGADVINMSLGFRHPGAGLALGISYAYGQGVVMVGAAGNQGAPELLYPARYRHTIGVGAVAQNGRRAPFSNYGSGLTVVAPGVRVPARAGKETSLYTGTSVAAAQVSGLVGLLRSVNRSLSRPAIELILQMSAGPERMFQVWNRGDRPVQLRRGPEYGYGLINACRAVETAKNWGRIVDPSD